MHETGHSKPVHWDNPEGGMGREVGGGFGMGGTCTVSRGPMADSLQCMEKKKKTLQYCKVISL